jgi:hypothetical protein
MPSASKRRPPLWPVALWCAFAGVVPACSLLLSSDAIQCRADADCARFPGTICEVGAGICVAAPPSDAGPFAMSDAVMDDAGSPAVEGALGVEAGGGGAAGADGAGGEAGTGGRMGLPCPDLDGNGVLDCFESLVTNPDFRTGIAGWTSELGMTQSFRSSDGAGDGAGNPASGSLSVTNPIQSDAASGLTMGGSNQCLPASGPPSYDLYLEVAVPGGADSFVEAGDAVAFFPTSDCTGPAIDSAPPTLVDQTVTGWQVLHDIIRPSPGTVSLLVRLVVAKPFTQAASQAQFDNILFKGR